MTGKREQICARLFAIGQGVHDWTWVQRNVDEIPPHSLPLFGLWDGGQTRVESDTRQMSRALAPFLCEMTPTLAIAVPGTVDNVGAEANELHDALMHAVLSDTQLYALIANKEVRYLDTVVASVKGTEETAITMNLNFALRYHLVPADLPPGILSPDGSGVESPDGSEVIV
jgi:hypothetical protein